MCGSTGCTCRELEKDRLCGSTGYTYREWERERLYVCGSTGVSKKSTTIICRIVGDVNEILLIHTRDDPTVLYETYAIHAHTHKLPFVFICT